MKRAFAGLVHWLAFAPIWCLRGVLRALPLDRSLGVGAAIGRLWVRLGGPRTEVARINLRVAFPQWSEARREDVLLASFENVGRSLAEASHLQGDDIRELASRIRIEGFEHYEAAAERSNRTGVIVVTAHFGSWELLGVAAMARGYPLCTVYQSLGNPYLDRMVAEWRENSGMLTLRVGRAGFGVMRALARGRHVGLLMDQDAGREDGIFAPFFTRLASTRLGPVLLAVARDVPVIPIFLFREADGKSHVARVYPELEMENGGEDALLRNVARINRAIETAVEEGPENFVWIHKRWKTRPEDEERIYPRRRSPRRRLRKWLAARRAVPARES